MKAAAMEATPESAAETGPPAPPPRNASLTALGLIVIAAVVLFAIARRQRDVPGIDAALAHPAVGAPLADFDVAVLTGDGGNVASTDLHGNVTLISFWGPWCPPCLDEFPHLAKLAEKLRHRKDIRWLPVAYGRSLDAPPSDLRRDVTAFLARGGWTTATYHDPQQSLLGAASAAGAFEGSFPCTVLVDKSGHVHAVWNGYNAGVEEQVETAVMELLQSERETPVR
jgi:thiol-disulfide isomerase/thioredoxin